MPLMRKYRDLDEFDAVIAANDREDQRRADDHSLAQIEPLRGRFESIEEFRQFLLAGKATFTVVSRKTGERLTLLARRPKPDPLRGSALRPVWLSVLTGPDNTTDYGFLGTLWVKSDGTATYRPGSQTAIGPEAPSQRAAQWIADGLSSPAGGAVLFRHAEFWHEGRCGRCGRKLTVPESVARGFGPECAGLV